MLGGGCVAEVVGLLVGFSFVGLLMQGMGCFVCMFPLGGASLFGVCVCGWWLGWEV